MTLAPTAGAPLTSSIVPSNVTSLLSCGESLIVRSVFGGVVETCGAQPRPAVGLSAQRSVVPASRTLNLNWPCASVLVVAGSNIGSVHVAGDFFCCRRSEYDGQNSCGKTDALP